MPVRMSAPTNGNGMTPDDSDVSEQGGNPYEGRPLLLILELSDLKLCTFYISSKTSLDILFGQQPVLLLASMVHLDCIYRESKN